MTVIRSAREARAIQTSLEGGNNMACESRLHLLLDSEAEQIQQLLQEGKYEEARALRLGLFASSEAERVADAKALRADMNKTEISRRLGKAQETALGLTLEIEAMQGVENPTGEPYLPLILSSEEMNEKGIGELFNRLHDVWFLIGLKHEALAGNREALKKLELMERVSAKSRQYMKFGLPAQRKALVESSASAAHRGAGVGEADIDDIGRSEAKDHGENGQLLTTNIVALPPQPQATPETMEGAKTEEVASRKGRIMKHWRKVKTVMLFILPKKKPGSDV
ncbi:hypothetical protein DRE_07352 [Drechslerella stenobrocha 248]|uniref:Uncharacterized protein n=1 Tax=Drechslerella stenobrocha 248 TaxID=1043628 RepID=W7HUS0_9PEZI|nr:hypothetical protein DRE_07352 [Drechslerella stenobrocha 248]